MSTRHDVRRRGVVDERTEADAGATQGAIARRMSGLVVPRSGPSSWSGVEVLDLAGGQIDDVLGDVRDAIADTLQVVGSE